MMFRAFLAAAAILFTGSAIAQVFETENGRINVATVTGGLAQPWGIDFLPDGPMIVTEKPGRLRIVTADGWISPPSKGVPKVDDGSQGGLTPRCLTSSSAW